MDNEDEHKQQKQLEILEPSAELFMRGHHVFMGDVTQETSYMAPSEEATTSVGTVNIQTDVTFTLTGVSATSSTGTLGGIFWSQVDDSNSSLLSS